MLLLAAERLAVLESLLPTLTFQPGPPSFSKRAPSQRMIYFVKDRYGLFNILKIESVKEWKKLSNSQFKSRIDDRTMVKLD